MYINKFWTFVACVPLMLSSGVTYSFAVWADSLKKTYGLDQTHIQSIGSACNIGGFCAILAGIFYDQLEAHGRLGPRLTVLVGACLNVMGYLGLWAAATRRFDAQYWQLLTLAFVACNGGTWFDAACLVTNVRNFPNNRGMVVGVMKSGIGLSAAFYTTIYLGLLQPLGPANYLLFLAVAPAAAALAAGAFLNHVPFVQQSELEEGQHVFTTEGRFLFALEAVAALAVFLGTSALAGGMLPHVGPLRLLLTAGAGLLLLPLLVVPWRSGGLRAVPAHPRWRDAEEGQLRPRAQRRRHLRTGRLVPLDPESPEAPLLGPQPHQEDRKHAVDGTLVGTSVATGGEGQVEQPAQLLLQHQQEEAGLQAGASDPATDAGGRGGAQQTEQPLAAPGPSPLRKVLREVPGAATKPPAPPNLPPLRCLVSLDFWLLFAACCAGCGAGLTLNNNLGQLVRALGGHKDGQDVFVSLFGVANCCGRLLMGYVPERMLHSSGVPRPLFLVVASLLTAIACAFLAFARLPALYPLSLLSGLAFGAHWSLMPSLVSELFGLQHFATNYTMVQLAPAVGSVALSSRLAGWLYQRAIAQHGWHGKTCKGQDCFRTTFLVLTGLAVLATACSSWLYLRTRELYYSVTFSALHQHDLDMERHHGGSAPAESEEFDDPVVATRRQR